MNNLNFALVSTAILVAIGNSAGLAQVTSGCCGVSTLPDTVVSPAAGLTPAFSAARVYGSTPVVREYYYPYTMANYGGTGSAAYYTGSHVPGVGYSRAWVGDSVNNWQRWHHGYPSYAGSTNPYFLAYGYRPTVSSLYGAPWSAYRVIPHVPYSYPPNAPYTPNGPYLGNPYLVP